MVNASVPVLRALMRTGAEVAPNGVEWNTQARGSKVRRENGVAGTPVPWSDA
jgi:hypothetical protein